MLQLSVNLITWNGLQYLRYSWPALINQDFADFEIIVIDNGSCDGTIEFLEESIRKSNKKIQFIKNTDNIGFASAHNQAIKLNKSEYICMLNQDIVLESNFLSNIIRFMDSHNNAGSCTGKLLRWNFQVSKNEQNKYAGEDFFNLTKEAKTSKIDSIGLQIFKNYRVTDLAQGEEDSEIFNNDIEVFGVSGAAPVYRRSSLEAVKISALKGDEYFDEDFFSYKEDVDLAHRLRLAGFKSYFAASARAYHDRSAAGVKQTRGAAAIFNRKNKPGLIRYHSFKNQTFFLLKNATAKTILKFFPHIAWYELKRIGYILLFEWPSARAIKEVFKLLPKMLDKRKIIMANKKVSDKEIWKWLASSTKQKKP